MPSLPSIIQIAKVSQFLALVDIEQQRKWGGGIPAFLPNLLYSVRKNVEWLYNLDPTNTTLIKTGNYLYALCAPYSGKAQDIIAGGGSGGVSPVTSTSVVPFIFTVSPTSTPLSDGQTTATLSSFIGFNLVYVRNGIPQTTITTESSYYSWNKVTGLFVTTPAVLTSETIILMPV